MVRLMHLMHVRCQAEKLEKTLEAMREKSKGDGPNVNDVSSHI